MFAEELCSCVVKVIVTDSAPNPTDIDENRPYCPCIDSSGSVSANLKSVTCLIASESRKVTHVSYFHPHFLQFFRSKHQFLFELNCSNEKELKRFLETYNLVHISLCSGCGSSKCHQWIPGACRFDNSDF